MPALFLPQGLWVDYSLCLEFPSLLSYDLLPYFSQFPSQNVTPQGALFCLFSLNVFYHSLPYLLTLIFIYIDICPYMLIYDRHPPLRSIRAITCLVHLSTSTCHIFGTQYFCINDCMNEWMSRRHNLPQSISSNHPNIQSKCKHRVCFVNEAFRYLPLPQSLLSTVGQVAYCTILGHHVYTLAILKWILSYYSLKYFLILHIYLSLVAQSKLR